MARSPLKIKKSFWIGGWFVDPLTSQMHNDNSVTIIEPEAMALLTQLAEKPGHIISLDKLETFAWGGVEVGYNVVADTIIQLRKYFQESESEDEEEIEYIQTVPEKGYRLVMPVSFSQSTPASAVTQGEQSHAQSNQHSFSSNLDSDLFSKASMRTNFKLPGRSISYTIFFSFFIFLILYYNYVDDDASVKNIENKIDVSESSRKNASALVQSRTLSTNQSAFPQSLTQKNAAVFDSNIETTVVANNEPSNFFSKNPSIAILPFNDERIKLDDDYLANGFLEELIFKLSLLSNITVTPGRQTSLYRGQLYDVETLANQLNVKYILNSDIKVKGDEIQVRIELFDAVSGVKLWAEKINRHKESIFIIYNYIIDNVAELLQVEITGHERMSLGLTDANNYSAYKNYLSARAMLKSRMSASDNDSVQVMVERAIKLDPNFTRAHAMLSMLHTDAYKNGWSDDPASSARLAVEIGERAVLQNSDVALGHLAVGYSYLFTQGDHRRAIEASERIIVLEPNNANGYTLLSAAHVFDGNPEKAKLLLEGLIEYNPHYRSQTSATLGLANLLLGNTVSSVSNFDDSLLINSNQIESYTYKTIALFRAGKVNEARSLLSKINTTHSGVDVKHWVSLQPFRQKQKLINFQNDLHSIRNI